MTQSFKSVEPFPNEISRVVVSGQADKASIFVAQGTQIRGVTRKGKEFFKIDSSHAETISQLHVQGINLWSAGKSTLTCYSSQNATVVDKFCYVCDEEINDMLIVQLLPGNDDLVTVLACSDGSIRVISDKGKVLVD